MELLTTCQNKIKIWKNITQDTNLELNSSLESVFTRLIGYIIHRLIINRISSRWGVCIDFSYNFVDMFFVFTVSCGYCDAFNFPKSHASYSILIQVTRIFHPQGHSVAGKITAKHHKNAQHQI